MSRPVFLCEPRRTPIGSYFGTLSAVSATELGAAVVRGVVEAAKLPPDAVNEVIMGCVLTAGLGQAPARQVAINGGLPVGVQACTVNKVCSSGLKAVMLAAQQIELGDSELVIAGGMESMSQAPYLLPSLRQGARLGHVEAKDSIVLDGLWDVYNDYHMGSAAELCARTYGISREEQDRYTVESYRRALKSIDEGSFRSQIVPIQVKAGKNVTTVEVDEEPGKLKVEKVPELRPVFEKDGTVTAANASSLSDGAAAMIVCSEEAAARFQLQPYARIVSRGWNAQAPEWFTTAPVGALRHALERAKQSIESLELIELNEAFAAVALACGRDLKLDADRLNVSGGAVALGHPIGASGARILTTLLHDLRRLGKRSGAVAICNGGGEATALIVERV